MNRDDLVYAIYDSFGLDEAEAALDLILEEAAKVCPDVASAAAIRALKGDSQ
jgi:hypothetical protein